MKKIAEALKKQLNDINILEEPSPPFIPSERAKVNVGYKCNAKCYFCYYHIASTSEDVFSFDMIKYQMETFKNFGIKDIDFSGGEPTIHPDILKLVELASEMGFRKKCIITNGFRFSNIDFMKRCVDSGLNDVLISLHGDQKNNDFVMGTHGAFKMTVKAIENAKLLGLKPRVNTVVNGKNYTNLPELAKILNDLSPFNHNFIGFRHCYQQIGADVDKTVRFSLVSPYLIESMDIETKIPFVNIRYIPFCFAKGYEKNVSNYPQKIYDPLEWVNSLLPMVNHYCEEPFYNTSVDGEEDKKAMNNEAVNCNRFMFEKASKCILCKNLFICDGFETEYSKKYDIEEADPYKGKPVKDPLFYRHKYYERIYDEL